MGVVIAGLRLGSTLSLLFKSYKLLSKASIKDKNGKKASERKTYRKEIRSMLICWIVWMGFLWLEKYLDQSYFVWIIPFYDQVKFVLMGFLYFTRIITSYTIFSSYIEPIFVTNWIGETLEILEGLLEIVGSFCCKAPSILGYYLHPKYLLPSWLRNRHKKQVDENNNSNKKMLVNSSNNILPPEIRDQEKEKEKKKIEVHEKEQGQELVGSDRRRSSTVSTVASKASSTTSTMNSAATTTSNLTVPGRRRVYQSKAKGKRSVSGGSQKATAYTTNPSEAHQQPQQPQQSQQLHSSSHSQPQSQLHAQSQSYNQQQKAALPGHMDFSFQSPLKTSSATIGNNNYYPSTSLSNSYTTNNSKKPFLHSNNPVTTTTTSYPRLPDAHNYHHYPIEKENTATGYAGYNSNSHSSSGSAVLTMRSSSGSAYNSRPGRQNSPGTRSTSTPNTSFEYHSNNAPPPQHILPSPPLSSASSFIDHGPGPGSNSIQARGSRLSLDVSNGSSDSMQQDILPGEEERMGGGGRGGVESARMINGTLVTPSPSLSGKSKRGRKRLSSPIDEFGGMNLARNSAAASTIIKEDQNPKKRRKTQELDASVNSSQSSTATRATNQGRLVQERLRSNRPVRLRTAVRAASRNHNKEQDSTQEKVQDEQRQEQGQEINNTRSKQKQDQGVQPETQQQFEKQKFNKEFVEKRGSGNKTFQSSKSSPSKRTRSQKQHEERQDQESGYEHEPDQQVFEQDRVNLSIVSSDSSKSSHRLSSHILAPPTVSRPLRTSSTTNDSRTKLATRASRRIAARNID